MPLFEYYCPECSDTFETLRPAVQADAPAPCPTCQQLSAQRILSLFATAVKTNGNGDAMMRSASIANVGGGCCGGACGCHG